MPSIAKTCTFHAILTLVRAAVTSICLRLRDKWPPVGRHRGIKGVMMKARIACLAALAPLAFASPAAATVQVDNTTQLNTGFTVSDSDLLQTSVASIETTGNFNEFASAGVSTLTDGTFGTLGPNPSQVALAASASIIFNFASAQTITQIATYAGWDSFRGGQSYTVSYATFGSPNDFVTLASVFNNANGNGGNNNTRAVITDTSGVLASNVGRIRFTFNNDLLFGAAAYRELDVFGSASVGGGEVPEPAAWAMMIFGFGMVGMSLRRRTRSTIAA